MADQVQEIIEVPKEFLKDGLQFISKSQKPDRREFIKISQFSSSIQAVGVGFLIMGAVGYVVKLIHIPLNNILMGGA
ncbi:hypothetical protein V8F20_010604 [Naviculisporaceae sp. PSN 640]